ncbi:MAG: hypothetical protein KIT31_06105 [Deltaproteobacteria bacterium]|nr:hypothetical protein [Deltaproteobacteria bacterium]
MRIVVAVVVAFAVAIAGARAAFAQGGFYASSPGDLTPPHGSLAGAGHCDDCHVTGTKEVSDRKCLGCHDHGKLAARIAAGQGFHATSLVTSKACKTCHHEHQRVSLMGWPSVGGEAAFAPRGAHDRLTGYPLEGAHAALACARCHAKTSRFGDRLYLGVEKTCGGCHAKDQPHRFVRAEMLRCERCHTDASWRARRGKPEFDHDDRADTAMPLIGEHRSVACAKCHPKAVFDLPFRKPAACDNAGCHRSAHDKHLFGTRPCDLCHSPSFKSFKQETARDMPMFHHKAVTRFELGNHAKLRCKQCHTDARGEARPGIPCEQCHAKDHRHGERFRAFGGSPPACGTCHPTTGWRPTAFDHGRTRMALEAKHAQVACRACHRGKGPAEWESFTADPSCKGCHQHRTVHRDAKHPNGRWDSDRCMKCHVRPGDRRWRSQAELEKEFHGPSSSFPLVKAHGGKACTLCHKSKRGAGGTSFGEESPECGERCHEDSLHWGTLGTRCTPCHTSGSWGAEVFDHEQPFPDGGAFPRKGGHRDAPCEACHPTKQYKDTPRTCAADACHGPDDAHKGRLGKECQLCHVETGDMIFNHNTQSVFRIDGKHLKVRCADCHPSVTFKPRPRTCFGCHPEPAVHKGQYGTGCEQCHTTRTWGDVKPLHDVGDFSLRGQHNHLACERCHRDNRPLAGSGNLCINCHRNDDIHANSLSPRCGECHTQWSFAPARFDHSRVGCNLTGLHRTLSCFGCHPNGNFAGLSGECGSCHRDDAAKAGLAGGVDHTKLPGGCAACHNANVWKPATGGGRESVCR